MYRIRIISRNATILTIVHVLMIYKYDTQLHFKNTILINSTSRHFVITTTIQYCSGY